MPNNVLRGSARPGLDDLTAEGTGTRLDLEHRAWERLGEQGPVLRESYDTGWPVTLGKFAEAAS